MKYATIPIQIEAVQVLRADFDGEALTSPPFSEAPAPRWITEAIDSRELALDIVQSRGKLVALWKLEHLDLHLVPGMWIVRDSPLSVVSNEDFVRKYFPLSLVRESIR